MAPFIVMLLSFLILRLTGVLGITYFDEWETSLRVAVALMFLFTASAHWGKRRPDLIKMVPSSVPNPGFMVTLTGILEMIGAICLLIPFTTPFASIGLAILLIILFPANIHATRKKSQLPESPLLLYYSEPSYKSYLSQLFYWLGKFLTVF
jgi:uncharacterized membrane protein